MAEERLKAAMLTGYRFFRDPNMPTIGFLRLDTTEGPHFVMVTRQALLELADVCKTHSEELKEVQ